MLPWAAWIEQISEPRPVAGAERHGHFCAPPGCPWLLAAGALRAYLVLLSVEILLYEAALGVAETSWAGGWPEGGVATQGGSSPLSRALHP